ncbi:hypothetical protein D3C75_859300 [compost metagenome]
MSAFESAPRIRVVKLLQPLEIAANEVDLDQSVAELVFRDFAVWDGDDETDYITMLRAGLYIFMRRHCLTTIKSFNWYGDVDITTHQAFATTRTKKRLSDICVQRYLTLHENAFDNGNDRSDFFTADSTAYDSVFTLCSSVYEFHSR